MFKVKLFLLTTSALMAMYSSLPIEQNRSYDYPQANPDENRGRNKHFLEGDILISKDEARQMFERRKAKQSERRSGRSARSVDGQHQVERRSAHYKYYKTWYNRTIPYDFDNKIHDRPEDRLRIQNAMTIIESVSCVRFVRRVDQNDYIIFRSGEDSCHSKVGRLGGAQEVNLGPDCLHSQGVVLHEILHAMGFWHEQSRMDRDDYVEVLWNNIEKDHWPNFDARDPPEDLDRIFLELPYDYGSIMHYSNTTFLNEHALRDNDVCLKPKKELQKGVVMGQRDGLSQTDIAKIKALYRCDIRNCSQPPQPENGTVDVISTSVSATVHYTCDPGFTLVGARDRVCRSNGHWSGETPVCLATDKTPLFHYCDFERPSHNLCGWIQANDDDLNWTFQKGHTTTEETGPYWDHTLGTVYGTYLYVEASSRMVVKGRKARLISPVFDLGKAKPCLIVYTSMYGQTMGNLTVYFTDRSTAIPIDTNLFTIIGDQGQYWKQIFLELDQANGPFMITLEASAGNGILSDIAIDDLIVGECDLLAPLAKSTKPEHYQGRLLTLGLNVRHVRFQHLFSNFGASLTAL
ncbi:metalloendopeptidase [Plakobranchus ocellatus]|uniref:Metalloendopeptidase n=1 Tax=Plakobranchus ocellatus TaxID=259542 RepID=A0AAV4D1S1_9GAST|nr:metalloendopeptidase [Plakobranchus ocellatus]